LKNDKKTNRGEHQQNTNSLSLSLRKKKRPSAGEKSTLFLEGYPGGCWGRGLGYRGETRKKNLGGSEKKRPRRGWGDNKTWETQNCLPGQGPGKRGNRKTRNKLMRGESAKEKMKNLLLKVNCE